MDVTMGDIGTLVCLISTVTRQLTDNSEESSCKQLWIAGVGRGAVEVEGFGSTEVPSPKSALP